MYKQLIEDCSEQTAIEAASQWRSIGNNPEVLSREEAIARAVAGSLFKSQDIKDLIRISYETNYMLKTLKQSDDVQCTLSNIITGMIIGFKYAMYLHEQRELAALETK
jgi:hypothetical protein